MPRMCWREHPDPNLAGDHCTICRKYLKDPVYRAFCDGTPKPRDRVREKKCEEAVAAVVGEVLAGRMPEGARVVRRDKPRGGPGTELMRLLKGMGLKPKAGCQCKQRARQMDAWGVEGCRANRETIRGRLAESWGQMGWGEALAAAARAVAAGTAFRLDPRDVPGSLLDEAIRRVEEKGE